MSKGWTERWKKFDVVIKNIDSQWNDIINHDEWLVAEIMEKSGVTNLKIDKIMNLYSCTKDEAAEIIVNYAIDATRENEELRKENKNLNRRVNNYSALIDKYKKDLLLLNVPESDFPNIDLNVSSDKEKMSYIHKMKNFYEEKKAEKEKRLQKNKYNKKVKILKNKFFDIKELSKRSDLEWETLILIKKLINFIQIESWNISKEKKTSLKIEKLDLLLKNIETHFFEIEKKIEEFENLTIYEKFKKNFF